MIKTKLNQQPTSYKHSIVATVILFIIVFIVILGIFTPIIELGKEEGIAIIISSVLLYALYLSTLNLNIFRSKLHYTQDFLDKLKTNTPDLIYIKDLNSEVIDYNQAFKNFINLQENEIFGNNFFYLFSEDERNDIAKFEKFVLSTQQSAQFNIHLKDANNIVNTFQVLKSPMIDKVSNKLIGTLNICRNITQQEEYYNTKKTFVETLAHDIKNPIIAQSKILEFLLEKVVGDLNPEQENLIKHVISSNQFALEMVTSMLASYKFSSQYYKFQITTFDIKKVVEEVINQLKITAYSKNIAISLNSDCLSSPNINADQMTIQRVLVNFLFNAITYSNENGSIDIELATEDKHIKVTIRNTAIRSGLTKENMHKIFDKYYIATNKYKQVGSGIGLYLAKCIIEGYGGELIYNAESKDNLIDCYTFGFKIPANNANLNGTDFKIQS